MPDSMILGGKRATGCRIHPFTALPDFMHFADAHRGEAMDKKIGRSTHDCRTAFST